MQIYYGDIKELNTKTAVALGRFDAMHIGHMEIISKAVEYAKENGMKSLIFMFLNNPLEVVTGNRLPSVNSVEKRMEILKEHGVDIVVAKEFDRELMNMSCEEFVDRFLCNSFRAEFVTAGYNYSFGRGGAGNINTLRQLCGDIGIQVCEIPEVKAYGEEVSSTKIRDMIKCGEVEAAAKLMGRYYSVSGEVVRGNGIGGSILGFPTANIALPEDAVLPSFGVYISKTYLDGAEYPSVTNIGGRPTVEEGAQLIETHIDADFGELYGKRITVEFRRFIRGIQRFESKDALAEQLEKDKKSMNFYYKNKKK